jgi:hypothetical protein
MEQASLLKERRCDELDMENLIEELQSLGNEQYNKLESALRVLMMHMLKWDYQPKYRSRSWVFSIRNQRLDIEDILAKNPGLKPRVQEALKHAYRRSRIDAAQETGLGEDCFPDNPYSLTDLIERKFEWE